MTYDPYPFKTLQQSQLGQYFGVSSHVVGRWLKDLGLRQQGGEPSPQVIQVGLVEMVDLGDGHHFWAWQKERTISILEAAGHKRIEEAERKSAPSPVQSPILDPAPKSAIPVGPFESKRSNPEGDGFEIADSNGVVAIWVRGERFTKIVAEMLNYWHKKGVFQGAENKFERA
jgi:hypothetical protein